MDRSSRGRPPYNEGRHKNEGSLEDIPPDYEEETTRSNIPSSSMSSPHRSPVDYSRNRVGPSPGLPRVDDRSSIDIVNRGGDNVNPIYRSVSPPRRDRSDRGYSPDEVSPPLNLVRTPSMGSGSYDNQGYVGQDDYERQQYLESQQGMAENRDRNHRLVGNGGFDGSSRDFSIASYSGQRGIHNDIAGTTDQYYGSNRQFQPENDTESVFTIDLGSLDAHNDNVWDKLHTIRLRRKSQKSRKLARTLSRHRRSGLDSDTSSEVDEGLLPSLQVRTRPKPLHERLAVVRTTADAADALRATAHLQPGSVASVKRSIKTTWQKNHSQIKGWLYQLELWAGTFKEIEGRFGMATVAYFRFTRWLLLLNVLIFLLMFCVVVIPYWALRNQNTFEENVTVNKSNAYFITAKECTNEYAISIQNITESESVGEKVLDFVQGTGWMERTVLFYGVYYNRTYPLPDDDTGLYNMSLAYLLTTGICFVISFILIVKNSSKSVKEAVVDRESSKTLYCNKIFAAWDFCICNEKAAGRKMKSLKHEIEDDLKEQRRMQQQANRTTREKCCLVLIRLFINLFVIITLGASLYLISYTTGRMLELQKQRDLSEFLTLLIQYLPSLTITILNFLIPLMFAKVVIVEDYGGAFELKITLVRTVLLRLASLGVLIISLYIQLLGTDDDDSTTLQCGNQRWSANNATDAAGSIKCWETYVGQQFYKLALLDFVAIVLLTFLVEFPRKFVFQRLNRFKLIRLVGEQEFDLPKNVLDIIYSQTLCWLGMFFSPLLPAITLLKVLIIFYVKKLTVLYNCIPPERPYRASRSNSFFMTVLLFSFILSVIPLGYLVGKIPPSQSCGPFRLYSDEDYVIFDTITNTVNTWPVVAKDIFSYLGTVGFFVPAILLLCLLMYYYWAASQGYKKMEQLLRDQLKLEGRDRQYLLSRVNEAIQRGEFGAAVN